MKAVTLPSKRFLGGVLVSGSIALAALTPLGAHASSVSASTHNGIPKRCQYLENELQNLSPADFPNVAAYQAAVRAVAGELRACETKR